MVVQVLAGSYKPKDSEVCAESYCNVRVCIYVCVCVCVCVRAR